MPVIIAWLRLDLRRRWRSLAVLGLLVAISAGVVLTALAGARRGASALTRLQDRTLPATAVALPNQPGFDWDKVRALPEVEALTGFAVDYNMAFEGLPGDVGGFPAADDAVMRTIERPVVLAGRVFDPAAADEVVVSALFVKNFHKGVGDTVVLQLPTPAERALATGEVGKLSGPRVTLRIVGVIRSPWFSDAPGSPGGLQMSPGVTAKYHDNIIGSGPTATFVNALIRLRGGEATIPRFRQDLARVTGRSDIDVWNRPDQLRQEQRSIAFEARCLLAFGGAALVAALFLVGPAIARYVTASTAELQTMRALGMTPRQAVATAAAGPAIAGLLGALIGTGGALVASRWFPIGSASALEPTPGISADWTVIGPGPALVTLLVVAGSVLTGGLALGSSRRTAASRRSGVALAAARAGLPVPVVIGTRFALETGRGRAAVPVRPALIGAVAGVLGILAAFTFAHGVSDAASNPARFGQTYDLGTYIGENGQDFGPARPALAIVAKNPDVTGVNDARVAVATGPGGDTSVTLWTDAPVDKPIEAVLTQGRLPQSANEVVLAPQSVSRLHTGVGRQVTLTGDRSAAALTVTGVGFVPEGPHNGYAEGGWITSAGFDALFTGFKYHLGLVAVRHGADAAAVGDALAKAVTRAIPQAKGITFDRPDPLTEVALLRQVRVLPVVLGFFLALLAVGAVGHALATAVRRRSHDLAVLRALGMTRGQCRWVIVTQASVLAVIGLIFGVPLGLALGRSVWRVAADYTPLYYVAPVALWALLLVAPAALVVSNLLAAWPGRRAGRLRIANILRSE
ncbi:MAG TPA: FtsX-like permease family protein [Jatrophihabitantaceae bacterium]|jgi:hypothetical protein